MTKRTHRIILTGYLAFEVLLAVVRAVREVRLPEDLVVRLFAIYGHPTPLPTGLLAGIGVVSCLLFLYSIIGLYLFWPLARPIFVIVLLGFAAIHPLKPFYVYSGWHQLAIHLRLLFHGFIICMLYLGPSRVYFTRTSSSPSSAEDSK